LERESWHVKNKEMTLPDNKIKVVTPVSAISQIVKNLGLAKTVGSKVQPNLPLQNLSLRGNLNETSVIRGAVVSTTYLNTLKVNNSLLDSPVKKRTQNKKYPQQDLFTKVSPVLPLGGTSEGSERPHYFCGDKGGIEDLKLSTSRLTKSTSLTTGQKKIKGEKPKVLYTFKKGLDQAKTPMELNNSRSKKDLNFDLKKSKLLSASNGLISEASFSLDLNDQMKSLKERFNFIGGKKILKKRLTLENVNEELHEYRLNTDKIYKKQIKKLTELRPTVEGKLKPVNLGPTRSASNGGTTYSIKENIRKNLGCLGVHPHHYDSLIGYRKGVPIVNNQKTLEDVRRVLNFLTKIINTPASSLTSSKSGEEAKMELLVILDNLPNLDTAEGQNNYLSLLTITIARIRPLKNLVIVPKTMKEAIRYLTSKATIPLFNSFPQPKFSPSETTYKKSGKLNLTRVGTNPENLCGVLMINPAKSKLAELANLVFSKNKSGKGKQSSDSSLGAIGSLCAKKGIPLISLCDVSSPLTYCTYPITCNTRNLSEVYLVLDLLSYGLNQATTSLNGTSKI